MSDLEHNLASEQIEGCLDAVLGHGRRYPVTPYAVVAFSWGVYIADKGKIRWRHRKETAFAWRDKRIALEAAK